MVNAKEPHRHSANGRPVARGLAPVVVYEPWFPRCLESIKQTIRDGHPVLIRLHSGATYPADLDQLYLLDVESHAVMLVGYDDDKEAVVVADPWNKEWGGEVGGRYWLSYSELETQTVDCSLGMAVALAPIEVYPFVKRLDEYSSQLHLRVGFYIPLGAIMDRESWLISETQIECSTAGWTASLESREQCSVGNYLDFSFDLPSDLGGERVDFEVQCAIQGDRPYGFQDVIEYKCSIALPVPRTATRSMSMKCIA